MSPTTAVTGPRTAVRACLGRYAELTGRSGRAEHWWFSLTVLGAVVVVPVVGSVLAGVTNAAASVLSSAVVAVLTLGWALVVTGLVLPAIAVGVRRLHDTGRSGRWYLLTLTGVGTIVLVVWWALPGEPGANRFGEGPDAPAWPARERG